MYDMKVNVKLEQYNCKEELKEVSENFKFATFHQKVFNDTPYESRQLALAQGKVSRLFSKDECISRQLDGSEDKGTCHQDY